jgi:hypothetical protein
MLLIPYASVERLARDIERQFPSSERPWRRRLRRVILQVTRRGDRSLPGPARSIAPYPSSKDMTTVVTMPGKTAK